MPHAGPGPITASPNRRSALTFNRAPQWRKEPKVRVSEAGFHFCWNCSIGKTMEHPAPDLRIALYQPDIAGNTGTILRLAACFGLSVDLIEPAGFDLSDRALKRAGMDYIERAALVRHADWQAFEAWRRGAGRRLVLFSTRADAAYAAFGFQPADILLFGRESAGVPDNVHQAADARLLVPMRPGARSLNVALTAAIAAAEAIRQLGIAI
jgi:tRNA (cytidine/uridine-2'-O-)-methyltransferase